MEILLFCLLFLISVYPLFLVIRALQLSCKALKKYISEDR